MMKLTTKGRMMMKFRMKMKTTMRTWARARARPRPRPWVRGRPTPTMKKMTRAKRRPQAGRDISACMCSRMGRALKQRHGFFRLELVAQARQVLPQLAL